MIVIIFFCSLIWDLKLLNARRHLYNTWRFKINQFHAVTLSNTDSSFFHASQMALTVDFRSLYINLSSVWKVSYVRDKFVCRNAFDKSPRQWKFSTNKISTDGAWSCTLTLYVTFTEVNILWTQYLSNVLWFFTSVIMSKKLYVNKYAYKDLEHDVYVNNFAFIPSKTETE